MKRALDRNLGTTLLTLALLAGCGGDDAAPVTADVPADVAAPDVPIDGPVDVPAEPNDVLADVGGADLLPPDDELPPPDAGPDIIAPDVPPGTPDVPSRRRGLRLVGSARAEWNPAGGPHLDEILTHGDHVYVANSFHGVTTFALDGEGAPALATPWPAVEPPIRCTTIALHAPSETLYCSAPDAGHYAAETGVLATLRTNDAADPSVIAAVAVLDVGTPFADLAVSGDTLYAAALGEGLLTMALDADGTPHPPERTGLGSMTYKVAGLDGGQVAWLDRDLGLVVGTSAPLVAARPDGPLLDLDVADATDATDALVVVALGSEGARVYGYDGAALSELHAVQPRCVVAGVALTAPYLGVACTSGLYVYDLSSDKPRLFGFHPAQRVGLDVAATPLGQLVFSDWHALTALAIDPTGDVLDVEVDRGRYVRPGAHTSLTVRNPGARELYVAPILIGSGQPLAPPVTVPAGGDVTIALPRSLYEPLLEGDSRTARFGLGVRPTDADAACALDPGCPGTPEGLCAAGCPLMIAAGCADVSAGPAACAAACTQWLEASCGFEMARWIGCELEQAAPSLCGAPSDVCMADGAQYERCKQARRELVVHVRAEDHAPALLGLPAIGDAFPTLVVSSLAQPEPVTLPLDETPQRIVFYNDDCVAMWPQLRDLDWLVGAGREPDGATVVAVEHVQGGAFPGTWALPNLVSTTSRGAWGWLDAGNGEQLFAGQALYGAVHVGAVPGGADHPSDYVVDQDGRVAALERLYRGRWPLRPVVEARLPLEIGSFASGAFVPFSPGSGLEIVQGPQGGIHVEVGARMTVEGLADAIFVAVEGRTELDDEVVGLLSTPQLAVVGADGVYTTAVLPIIFAQDEAEAYLGPELSPRAATICVSVELPDQRRAADCVDVGVVDLEP